MFKSQIFLTNIDICSIVKLSIIACPPSLIMLSLQLILALKGKGLARFSLECGQLTSKKKIPG